MSRTWARLAVACGALLAALCLTGCDVRGTVDVRSDTDLIVDVTLTGLNRGMCQSITRQLTETEVERGVDSTGQRFCRVRGAVKTEDLAGVNLASAADYYVLSVGLDTDSAAWPTTDLTIRFPGQVVEASHGTVSGSSVRLDDLSVLAPGESLQVVALRRTGPPGWLIAAGLGVVAGALGTLAYQRWRAAGRRAGQESADGTAAEARESTDTIPAETAATPEEPQRDSDARVEATPSDALFFARPPTRSDPEALAESPAAATPEAVEPGPSPGSPRDHSMWAPPA